MPTGRFRACGRDQGFPIALDLRIHAAAGFAVFLEIIFIASIGISRPAGRDQGFPIALDLRMHALLDLQLLLEISIRFRGLRAATRSAAGLAAFRSPWTFGHTLLLDLQFLY